MTKKFLNAFLTNRAVRKDFNVLKLTKKDRDRLAAVNVGKPEEKNIVIGSESITTIVPSVGKDFITKVNVSLDSSIIKPENIKSGVTILGVRGTYEG